jgi:hypothetical protein
MSLWLHVKRREHPRSFLPAFEKGPDQPSARKAPSRRTRAAQVRTPARPAPSRHAKT